ncbi:MAG: hypothetical protein RLZZ66_180 [Pseudomonadota bacterium]|jgi:hypothetical protein
MGFFSSLFGTHSENAYTTTSARNAILAHDGTGVSRYLEIQTTTPSLSKVDKYLKSQELNQPSGVDKYLARQAINERNKPVVVLTGVAKYLNNNKDSAPVVKSGVERYLANQINTPMSGVAKYMLKKNVADRHTQPKPKTTRVESYLQSRPETTTSSVSKYLARQAIVTASQAKAEAIAVVSAVVESVAVTGVEKYLQGQR